MRLFIIFPFLFFLVGCAETTTHVNMNTLSKPMAATGKVINAAEIL